MRLAAAFLGVLGVGGGMSSDGSPSAVGVAAVVFVFFFVVFCDQISG